METDNPHNEVLFVQHLNTPLGEMIAGATNEGICFLKFSDKTLLEKELEDIRNHINAVILDKTHRNIEQLRKELLEYFTGERKYFDVPVYLIGTDFQKSVWKQLSTIPYGETLSYQQQAGQLGKLNSIRAIAHANGCNRISIVIPCHRVIGKDGKLTGYSGGIERKQLLLLHEKHYSYNFTPDLFYGLLNIP